MQVPTLVSRFAGRVVGEVHAKAKHRVFCSGCVALFTLRSSLDWWRTRITTGRAGKIVRWNLSRRRVIARITTWTARLPRADRDDIAMVLRQHLQYHCARHTATVHESTARHFARLLLHTCTAQPSHKDMYGSTGSHGRAKTPRYLLRTY
jgi:hypothetical protein